MRLSGFIAAMVVLAAANPAFAQDFCSALERIQAASHEPVMFASLEDGSELIPGYPHCRVIKGEDGFVNCSTRHRAPIKFALSSISQRVTDCLNVEGLPLGAVAQEFRTSGLSFIIISHCDDRCKVGRTSQIIVRKSTDSEN